jgi:hypothetical protein
MSINFRTRSQTIVDYSSYIQTTNVTGCCYVFDADTNTVGQFVDTTLSQCNQLNGYFMSGACDPNNTITPASTGCCCACSLFTPPDTSTYVKNTTLCECESIGGLWTLNYDCSSTQTPTQIDALCKTGTPEQSNVIDFRPKKACCHPEVQDDGTISSECTDVCNEKECAEKTIFPYISTFYNNGRKCDESVGGTIPVSLECQLNETNLNVLNSCDNGTNLFCWVYGAGTTQRCSAKEDFYDKYFSGKFLNKITHYVATIQNTQNISGEQNYLLPGFFWPENEVPNLLNLAKSGDIKLKKVCPGSLSYTNEIEEPRRYYDGYFGGITENNTGVFYASTGFFSRFENSSESPVGDVLGAVLDLIATRTFSAWASTNTTNPNVKIQGRFYNPDTEQYKTYSPALKLKKLYQHNSAPIGFDFYDKDYSTIGFAGQKLDNTFDYYSPFMDESSELQQIRDMIRSLPPKEYVNASFGVHTFCGIEQDGIMTCVSLNDEIPNSYVRSKKYKLVSCSNIKGAGPLDPSNDYCFAVDFENKFEKLGSIDDFNNQPAYSITDVTSLSCVNGSCQATVVPDIDVCNNQIPGSCCTCVDQGSCIQTTQGNCQNLDGRFRSGGICCSENPGLETCDDCTDANCERNAPLRSVQVQDTLPDSELTYYQDGLYVGIFEPGSPLNYEGSTVNGRPFTGPAVNYKPSIVGYGTTAKKWAIIVAPFDFELEAIKGKREQLETIPASLYDGLWNTYGDNEVYYGIQGKAMENLRDRSRLSGWYLPSKNELEFINLKINHGFFIPEVFKSMNSAVYLTSTPFFRVNTDTTYNIDDQIFNDKAFMYGQSFKKVDYGSIYLVPRTDKVNVRLIRRIELE